MRGTRCGELIARCMVEVGTSSYYSALGDAAQEPVLREIFRRISADGLRHYKMFTLPPQPVDATQALNLSAGVSNPKVLRGRSLS